MSIDQLTTTFEFGSKELKVLRQKKDETKEGKPWKNQLYSLRKVCW